MLFKKNSYSAPLWCCCTTPPSSFRLRSTTKAMGYEPLKSCAKGPLDEKNRKQKEIAPSNGTKKSLSQIYLPYEKAETGVSAGRTWFARCCENSSEREIGGANRDFTSESAIRERMGREPQGASMPRACSRGVCTRDIARRWWYMMDLSRDSHLSGTREWSSRVGTRACSRSCSLSGTFSSQCGHCFSTAGYPGLSHQHGHGCTGG